MTSDGCHGVEVGESRSLYLDLYKVLAIYDGVTLLQSTRAVVVVDFLKTQLLSNRRGNMRKDDMLEYSEI